jgi:hypothetical protein
MNRLAVAPRARACAACLLAAGASLSAPPASSQDPPGAATGLHQDVVFTDYSQLSTNSELLRRLLSPLAAAQVKRTLASSGKQLLEQSVNLAQEKFIVYVPPRAPPQGYALLVFVPPWDAARVPEGWPPVLERYGVIFVSAARAGNDENVMGRREPLALLAAQNVMNHYRVNEQRVYVGGFSGGSRIALRLALGYPDVFHGALLNAGSDALDANPPALPPRELFLRFQENSRIVYVTGERDTARLAMDSSSVQSMRKWCVFDVDSEITAGAGHEPANALALSSALRALLAPAAPAPRKLEGCRAEIDRSLTAQLSKVEALIAGGQHAEAQQLLTALDLHFGGLAGPRSVELQSMLGEQGGR